MLDEKKVNRIDQKIKSATKTLAAIELQKTQLVEDLATLQAQRRRLHWDEIDRIIGDCKARRLTPAQERVAKDNFVETHADAFCVCRVEGRSSCIVHTRKWSAGYTPLAERNDIAGAPGRGWRKL